MSSTFLLAIDLTDHTHEHSERAHRFLIGQLLDVAKGAVGSGSDREGKLIYPAGSGKVIGNWKILSDDAIKAAVT